MNKHLVGKRYPQAETTTVSADAARAYAAATLGVGSAGDGDDGSSALAVYGTDVVHPMFCVVAGFGALAAPLFDPELGADMMRLVHGEQDMRWHRPLLVGDTLTSVTTIAAIDEKPTGEVLVEDIVQTNQRGEVVCETRASLFIRAPRGRSKEAVQAERSDVDVDAAAFAALPARFTGRVVVAADQSRRYAEASGDHNPIHLDEDVAKMAGLPTIILHGLCSMAFVHNALVRHVGGDPQKVRRLAVRFNKPVLMGDELVVDVRDADAALAFQVKNQHDVVVLKSGRAEFA